MVRLLKYSICKICSGNIKYTGRGRPREYCDVCKPMLVDKRRLYMLNYMRAYRERLRKMLYA